MNVFHTLARNGGDSHRLHVQKREDGKTSAITLDLPTGTAADADLRDGRKLALGIRPHQIRLGAAPQLGPVLKGKVTSNQWLGDQTHLGIETDGHLIIAVSDGDIGAPIDSEVDITLPLANLHLFDGENGEALHHGLIIEDAAA